MTRRFAPILLVLAVTIVVGCRSTADTDEVKGAISTAVNAAAPHAVEPATWKQVREFYADRSDEPAWIEGGRYASARATEAVELLNTSPTHGLSGDYGVPPILALHQRIDTL